MGGASLKWDYINVREKLIFVLTSLWLYISCFAASFVPPSTEVIPTNMIYAPFNIACLHECVMGRET